MTGDQGTRPAPWHRRGTENRQRICRSTGVDGVNGSVHLTLSHKKLNGVDPFVPLLQIVRAHASPSPSPGRPLRPRPRRALGACAFHSAKRASEEMMRLCSQPATCAGARGAARVRLHAAGRRLRRGACRASASTARVRSSPTDQASLWTTHRSNPSAASTSACARLQRQRAQRHRLLEHGVPPLSSTARSQAQACSSEGCAPGHAGARPHRGGPPRATTAPPRPCRRRAHPVHRRCPCALAWTGEAARCSMRRGAARRACPRASQPPPCAPACAPSSAPSPEAAPVQGRRAAILLLPPPRNRSLAASIAATHHLHSTSQHRARRPQSSSSRLEPRPAGASEPPGAAALGHGKLRSRRRGKSCSGRPSSRRRGPTEGGGERRPSWLRRERRRERRSRELALVGARAARRGDK